MALWFLSCLPAAGRWVLIALEVIGLGLPLLVYFFADFSDAPTGWGVVCPPLAGVAIAEGRMAWSEPGGLMAGIGYGLLGLAAGGLGMALPAGISSECPDEMPARPA